MATKAPEGWFVKPPAIYYKFSPSQKPPPGAIIPVFSEFKVVVPDLDQDGIEHDNRKGSLWRAIT